MRILVTNDDGIQAEGIQILAELAAELGEVVVVAPDSQRSAASHSITIRNRLYLQEHHLHHSQITAFSLSGTPVDCVKWAVTEMGSFQLALSGINEGANLATDVLYSGTVAAAGEAALQGIPSVALSLCGPPFTFSSVVDPVRKLLKQVVHLTFPSDTFLNVNIPPHILLDNDAPAWQVTELGARTFRDQFFKKTDEQGRVYYRYAGEAVEKPEGERKDVLTVQNGLISVTPLRYRFSELSWMHDLIQQLEESDITELPFNRKEVRKTYGK
ncbi:5'/3'-nucleotidase SurE [Alicyclobacillus tolerans]|uniref:5'/3'-nucleotidase SurE n=1 Tax=Alicyclobacillus tolerans TaxID=90970 RepID=UPI003B82C389